MPRTETLRCPSGLVVLIRSRKTRDYEIINSDDRQAMRRYNESVVMQTMDPGPYPEEQFYDDGRPRQEKGFLTADYWAIRLKHHQLNKPDMPFIKTFRCDGDGCGYTEELKIWVGDEDSDGFKCEDGIYRMRVKQLSKDAAAQFMDRNVFETSIDTGSSGVKHVQFQLSDMDCYERFRTYVRRYKHKHKVDPSEGQRMLAVMACRIIRVEGQSEGLQSSIDWYGSLDDHVSTELNNQMEAVDCGIDWVVYPECPRCDAVKTKDIDIDEHFFSRGRQRRSAASPI